jgi:hypothetical protein
MGSREHGHRPDLAPEALHQVLDDVESIADCWIGTGSC